MNRNPYPSGTNEYYDHQAKSEGFKSPQEWAMWHRNNNPVCRYCGIPQGFAMGTGDCGCDGEPGVPMFVENPNRDL